jgi:quercetin dioxygenase-like cupin family protein
MKIMRPVMAALCLLALNGFAATAHADDYQGVRATKILTSTTAANGQKLSYLKTGNPEVTAMIVEIPPGGETGWHVHAEPVYAYVLDGSVTVEMEGGRKYEFRKGDAIFEVRDTPHNGRNNGDCTAKLIVFYTGEVGKPNVTRVGKPEAKPEQTRDRVRP